MATESDPATTRITVVLDKPSDWHKWLFIRKDAAQKNDLWQYVDPATRAEDLPTLTAIPEPNLASYQEGATSIANLTAAQQKLYQWEYERWERKDIEYQRKRRALAEFNSDISKTIAAKHLYLIETKDTPYERLQTLKKHLAPSDATRQRELITQYKDLQEPPRGKGVEPWLRLWIEVTNRCMAANIPETTGSRAQEDFLITCRSFEPEFASACLCSLIELDEAGAPIPSVEDYVNKFTTYLRRVRPISTGLSAMASELEAAKPTETGSNTEARKKEQSRCVCGLKHRWVDCWILNPEHPRRPNSYTPKPTLAEKVKTARKKDSRLDESINQALASWREKNGVTVSVSLDDGKPPSKPTSNAVAYLTHKDEAEPADAVAYLTHKDEAEPADAVAHLAHRDDGKPPSQPTDNYVDLGGVG